MQWNCFLGKVNGVITLAVSGTMTGTRKGTVGDNRC